jgi:hypothetical protein
MYETRITCPYCWQLIDIETPAKSEFTVTMIVDCEVCCRPIRVQADWGSEDESPTLDVEAES